MSDALHMPDNSSRLLLRQIKKAFANGEVSAENVNAFIVLVNDAYLANEESHSFYSRAEKLANIELENTNRELQTKNDFLDTFNHGMAHDIKNHTSNIIGLINMLRKYLAREDAGMLLSIIERLDLSANQLTAIVQGFLYLSRAEANIDNQYVVIDGDEMMSAVKAEILFLTLKRECVINYNFEVQNLFFSFHVLKIILVNLISNSIKFSKKTGTITIDVSLRQKPGSIELVVKDNGVGMDLNDPDNKIFRLFNRAGDAKMIKGTGVGLFMIKKIIERHKGEVEIESEINKGTTFTITLPVN